VAALHVRAAPELASGEGERLVRKGIWPARLEGAGQIRVALIPQRLRNSPDAAT